MQILAKPSLFCYSNFLKLHSFIENILLKKKKTTNNLNRKHQTWQGIFRQTIVLEKKLQGF